MSSGLTSIHRCAWVENVVAPRCSPSRARARLGSALPEHARSCALRSAVSSGKDE